MKTKTKATIVVICALFVFLIDWGVMGIKLSMNDYDVQPETYIGLACWLVMIVGIIVRTLSDRCPHCGRVRMTGGLWGGGRFCSHCGKEIE